MNYNAPPVRGEKDYYRKSRQKKTKSYKLFDPKKHRFHNSAIKEDHYSKSKKKKNKEKNKYKIRISIDTEKLKSLENKDLIQLIQMIEYTCDLTLNDYRYNDKTCGIFKIIESKEKKGYDIIINEKKDEIEKEDKSSNNEEEEEKEDSDNNVNLNNSVGSESYFESNKKNNNRINFKAINFKEEEKKDFINEFNNKKYNNIIKLPNNKNNINSNEHKENKNSDFYQTLPNFYKRPKVFDETFPKNNPPPFPTIINKDKSEEEEEEEEEENEEEEEKYNSDIKGIKCTDCDLIYETIEGMIKHNYDIHNKIQKKVKKIMEKEIKSEEIDEKFEEWAEKRLYKHKNININDNNIKDKKGNNIN